MARDVLSEAERKVRMLAKDALEEGDYESVGQLTRIAQILAYPGLSASHEPVEISGAPGAVSKASRRQRAGATSEGNELEVMDRDAQFPRFERHGRRLVKLGWSNRDKRVYEHRAPIEVVEDIVKAIVEKVDPQRRVQVESILSAQTRAGEEVPSYQVYLVLKWLQDLGILERQGKDGYSLGDVDISFNSLWERTPTKSN